MPHKVYKAPTSPHYCDTLLLFCTTETANVYKLSIRCQGGKFSKKKKYTITTNTYKTLCDNYQRRRNGTTGQLVKKFCLVTPKACAITAMAYTHTCTVYTLTILRCCPLYQVSNICCKLNTFCSDCSLCLINPARAALTSFLILPSLLLCFVLWHVRFSFLLAIYMLALH